MRNDGEEKDEQLWMSPWPRDSIVSTAQLRTIGHIASCITRNGGVEALDYKYQTPLFKIGGKGRSDNEITTIHLWQSQCDIRGTKFKSTCPAGRWWRSSGGGGGWLRVKVGLVTSTTPTNGLLMDSPSYSYFHHHHNCRNKDNYKGRNENKSTAAVVCKSSARVACVQ